jgi:amidophosphoribosyltransferase
MPSAKELIAHNRTVEEIAQVIGADWLVYQDIDDLINAARRGNPSITRFDTSCFTGEYVTGDVSEDYLKHIEVLRNDAAKQEQEMMEEDLTDLSNST